MLTPSGLKLGRTFGCYVYFFCCSATEDAGHLYMKIGISERPIERLQEILTGCALEPLTYGAVHVYSRKLALIIENTLHLIFKGWRTNGEWFRFKAEEKDKFNSFRQLAFEKYRSDAWPMKLVLIDVKAIQLAWKRRTFGRLWAGRRKGKAFMDFERDQYT